MQRLAVADNVFTEDSPGVEAVLAAAHATKQRPRCLCATDGVPVYIAHIGERFIVKRMPNTSTCTRPSARPSIHPQSCLGLAKWPGLLSRKIWPQGRLRCGWISRSPSAGALGRPWRKALRPTRSAPTARS